MQATLAQMPSTVAADGSAAPPVSAAAIAGAAAAAGAGNAFVINLISSTTPVVLTRPDHAGLKRFTFFVSRRREDGRERFRLHMGYFDTQEEAEKLLDIVRTIYPGAWAGLAPGRRLGIHAASETAAAASPPAAPAANSASVSEPASPVKLAAVPATSAEARTLTESAAARGSSEPQRAVLAPAAPGSQAPVMRAASLAESTALPRSIEVPTLALVPDEGRRQLSDVTLDLEEPGPARAAAAVAPSSAASAGPLPDERKHRAARQSLSNVRETIASLGEGAIRAPALRDIPELQAAIIPTARPIERQPRVRAGAEPAGSAPVAAAPTAARAAELSDTGTLRLLETGNAARGAPASTSASGSEPQSQVTQKMRAGQLAQASRGSSATHATAEAPREEKPYYAVQLVWSVQPIATAQIPQLAIFNAYTLYGAEGNRDGRRWYGLRLGFFTDAVSAKQVAHYVRADFATVSVVPVTGRERDQALQAISRAPPGASATGAEASASAAADGASLTRVTKPGAAAGRAKEPQFAFIEGTDPAKVLRSNASRSNQAPGGVPRVGATKPGGGRPSRGAPGKRAKQRPAGQIHANTRTKPKTLEETLEILGAGQLQVAEDEAALLNDSGVRHLKLEAGKAKPSKLSRLIERLSERIGN